MRRLRELIKWRGRASRREYWLALGVFAASVVAGGAVITIATVAGLTVPGIILGTVLISLGSLPVCMTGFRRLRDRNRSPMLCVVLVLGPQQLISWSLGISDFAGSVVLKGALILAGLAFAAWGIAELCFLRGTVGRNRYGDDPLKSSADVFS